MPAPIRDGHIWCLSSCTQGIEVNFLLRLASLRSWADSCWNSPESKACTGSPEWLPQEAEAYVLLLPHSLHSNTGHPILHACWQQSAWCLANMVMVHLIPLSLSLSLRKTLNSTWSPFGSLKVTTCHQYLQGLQIVDCYPQELTVQPIPHPLKSPPIKSIKFREKDVIWDQAKGFALLEMVTSVALPLFTGVVTPSQKTTMSGGTCPLWHHHCFIPSTCTKKKSCTSSWTTAIAVGKPCGCHLCLQPHTAIKLQEGQRCVSQLKLQGELKKAETRIFDWDLARAVKLSTVVSTLLLFH